MQIKTVSIIGLGALGILFGRRLSEALPEGALRIVADKARIEKYRREGVYCNGERCVFNYMTPEEAREPGSAEFCRKYTRAWRSDETAESQMARQTIIKSLSPEKQRGDYRKAFRYG
jgi:2-dehydropantoate 2-reductase